jgi:L-ascorbate metabolism protein UlaG (beta-lactamase superfamily)
MDLQLVRSATLRIHMGGRCLLVDPMLDPAGARPPVEGTPNPRPNPLVELPTDAGDVVARVDATLVSHLHRDHLDDTATATLDRTRPLACQPHDEDELRRRGFTDVRPIHGAIDLCGIGVARTPGRHGRGAIAERLGPVSGFVLGAPGEPVLYIAGDTIWCDEVDTALAEHGPDVVVVNAGGARYLEGDPIIMDAGDVIEVARAAPRATIVAVHLEAINHCLLGRAELREAVDAAGVGEQVAIPRDGEVLRL